MFTRAFLATGALAAGNAFAADATRVLASFDADEVWQVHASNQVSVSLRRVDGEGGGAICLDYDYNGVSGYVSLRRDILVDFPSNYRLDLRLRGESPPNEFQFKFVDASGDSVWWINRPRYDLPRDWTPTSFRQRHVVRAWGPDQASTPARASRVEFTIYNNTGGRGSYCFDELTLTALPAVDSTPITARAEAHGSADGSSAASAVDGDAATAWRAGAGATLVLDLGASREFGGLSLDWVAAQHASAYSIELSDDGKRWRDRRAVHGADGERDWIAFPESEARYLRLRLDDSASREVALANLQVQPLAFAATPNDFVAAVAADLPRGWLPRGFAAEQSYWTLLGIDGGTEQGLLGEGGAIEVARGGFTLEPFVRDDGMLLHWANVTTTPSLMDGYLPIPSVQWTSQGLTLDITAFAAGTPQRSQLVARYRIINTSPDAKKLKFALALRPFQVNPPSQFLTTLGGVSRIESLEFRADDALVEGRLRVQSLQPASARFATAFNAGIEVSHIAQGEFPATLRADDASGLASGAWIYEIDLGAGESRRFDFLVPMTGAPLDCSASRCDAAALEAQMASVWRTKLDEVKLVVPPAGQEIADALRTATAHMLISRVGARLQPGTRSYGRSWIRDGAMISEGLLRMGRHEVVRDYIELFAPFQFKDGMVPCCIDDRGSDPVPENDSHGELIFNIAAYWRYTRDTDFLRLMWPHIEGAWAYMEKLRLSERTDANRAVSAAFYGMMPVSISHEGYSSKPVHSYWDNFWALRGYKDAADMALVLGKMEMAERMAVSRDQFRSDLDVSLLAAVKQHAINYLPGAAELGDFDPTSTTIALAPTGEQHRLPQALLLNTFEKYWQRFVARRDGAAEWKDYTPYEWRNVGAFVRLGQRDRAYAVLRYFFEHRTPRAWNQWAEVVSSTPRKPFFLGDLPHAWVASDFLRSALDMFAHARESDRSIVLAAGVPSSWLDAEGIALQGLHTPEGRLTYSMRREGERLRLEIDGGMRLPGGGFVWPWPYRDAMPGTTRINGKRARWVDGELRIDVIPAEVFVTVK